MGTELHHLNTPPIIVELIRGLDPKGQIGLDPCSNATSMVFPTVEFDGIEVDGLNQSWHRHGLVFVNPPHSTSPHNIEPWMRYAYEEFVYRGIVSDNDQLVMLVPAKLDTDWFHSYAVHFPVKCFLRGRLKYWQNGAELPGPGKFGSMLLYAGKQEQLFRDIFGPLGWCP